jgi:hypothetical protein
LERIPKDVVEISSHTKRALFKMEECMPVSVKPFKLKSADNLSELTIFIIPLNKPSEVLKLLSSELEKELK